jgi:protein-S-isoprenylcysteine O-methyltransferase Ste14
MMREGKVGFSARGGWWVAAQFPLLLLAYLIPLWTGLESSGALFQVFVYAGLLLFVAGLGLCLAGVFSLGRGLTPFPRPLPESVLRSRGAYALVRHPLYGGVIFMALGESLYSLSMAGALFDIFLVAFFDRKASREEQWLAEKFSDYAAYRQRVKKLIPWIY